jgi:lambda repressor-like predicted transcriptional regulator
MASTEDEHPHTVKHTERIQEYCQKQGIEFYQLTPEMGYHPDSWAGGLRGHYEKYDVIMSKAMRNKSCSDSLKIRPIYNFLSEYVNREFLHGMSRPQGKVALKEYAIRYGKIRVLLGITHEEQSRIDESKSFSAWMDICVEKTYPLVEMKYDRKCCQEYIREAGYQVPYPSNCMLCPFLSKIELLWLYRNYPDDFEYWLEREKAKIEKFRAKTEKEGKNNHGVWGTKMLDTVLEEAISEYGHMSNAELDEYKFSHGHCVKSKF